MTLIGFVLLYLTLTVFIGLMAARRVSNTQDFALAGRSLPLPMIVTATFATWFGSETVLGLPARFIEHGLSGIVEDPFGSGMALVLVGLFFARKLYKLNILTLADYYRNRFGNVIEILCTLFIVISYLGWVGAQVSALGLVINLVTDGVVSVSLGMVIGTVVVLLYTVYGGMWSVAVTDFVQMLIIVLGLGAILYCATQQAGGIGHVVEYAQSKQLWDPFPEAKPTSWLFWISAAITMMIGSIPQQDVFQRVMSAKSGKVAMAGPIIGGFAYILFAFVPILIVISAVLIMPHDAQTLLATDPQRLLPTLIRDYMPMWLRVVFFGAVLSAVMSTASATILAPSTTFVSNILAHIVKLDERHTLRAMRITVTVFALSVLAYSLYFEGTSIYDMVAMAYQFPVVGAFWPLACGLYWKRTTKLGVYASMILGGTVWGVLTFSHFGEVFPSVLGGFLAAGFGMIGGSLLPIAVNRRYLAWWKAHSEANGHFLYDPEADKAQTEPEEAGLNGAGVPVFEGGFNGAAAPAFEPAFAASAIESSYATASPAAPVCEAWETVAAAVQVPAAVPAPEHVLQPAFAVGPAFAFSPLSEPLSEEEAARYEAPAWACKPVFGFGSGAGENEAPALDASELWAPVTAAIEMAEEAISSTLGLSPSPRLKPQHLRVARNALFIQKTRCNKRHRRVLRKRFNMVLQGA